MLGFVILRWNGDAPDIGLIEPVNVPPAEQLETHELRPGQTLGQILETASVSATELNRLLLAFRERANPRAMRAGTEITLRRRSLDGWLRGIDVRLNADSTLRLGRDDLGWHAALTETPVRTDTLYGSGVIENNDNLWFALARDPALSELSPADKARFIDAMDRIYQWRVDFSTQLRAGDYYRVGIERVARPDGSTRDFRIIAGELQNAGKSMAAIWFDPNGDGRGDYYDHEGKTLKGAFLKKPLEFRRISSVFTSGRRHPVLGVWRAHRGVDYAAAAGTPVYATGDGLVTIRRREGGYGNLVELRHAKGFMTRYGHLRAYAAGLRVGRRVAQGDVIGYVGATGLATGPHLHYEMHQNGRAVNPLGVNIPSGESIPADSWERWLVESAASWTMLAAQLAPPTYLADTGAPVERTAEPGGS